MNRRQFLKASLASSLLGLNACANWQIRSQQKAHVVIIGGGFGGATAARYLRLYCPEIRISLIEPKTVYTACPGSNRVITGLAELASLSFGYQGLNQAYDIDILPTRVTAIDAVSKRLQLQTGDHLRYDHLILAPGIRLRWDTIEGYSEILSQQFPHAWQAGPQTLLLRDQITTLPDNGTVLICPPADPYRCPPGPYERASLIAHWLKRHKPRAKILILDPKRSFSKQALFEQAWRQHYAYGTEKALIEWHSLADNPIQAIDPKSHTVITEFGDKFRGDVINLIPPQTAGQIAIETGLTDQSGWCPINPLSSQSLLVPGIHVIGDAGHYAPIPKSAFAANSEAKHCALSIRLMLQDQDPVDPVWFNTCYSAVTDDQAISVSHVYRLDSEHRLSQASIIGGVSSRTDADSLKQEAVFGQAAYRHLLDDCFALNI